MSGGTASMYLASTARVLLLAGIALSASASGPEVPTCDGIEMLTYTRAPDGRLKLAEASCHTGSESFLPWIDSGIDVALPDAASPRTPPSVTEFESKSIKTLGVVDEAEIREPLVIPPSQP